MRSGRLDRLVTIQRRTITTGDSGVVQETWVTVALRRSASMAPVRGDERLTDPQKVAEQMVEFRVRYSADVAALSPLYRIIHPALDDEADSVAGKTVHDVLAAHEIGRREGVQIFTRRRPDVAQ